MTKLTTERLEKLQDDLLQFQDHYSDPADKENYDIFVDALHVLDEFKAAKEKLLAYEQAAKDVAFWGVTGHRGQIYQLPSQSTRVDSLPLYRAPALPKQPDATLTDEGDITKIVKAAEKLVRCKGRYHSEQNYRALAALFGVTVPDLPPLPADEAPAQPVPMEFDAAWENTGHLFVDNKQYAALFYGLGYKAAPAQPVSEPYKLDGLISVDEKMPEATRKDQYFITYRRPNKDFKSVTGGFSIDLFRKGCFAFSGVTHWMPLPAAPAQEQK